MKPLGWRNFVDTERPRCCLLFVHHGQLWNRKITFHGLGWWCASLAMLQPKKMQKTDLIKANSKKKWKKRTPKPSASSHIFARFIQSIHVNRQQTNTSSLNQLTTKFCSICQLMVDFEVLALTLTSLPPQLKTRGHCEAITLLEKAKGLVTPLWVQSSEVTHGKFIIESSRFRLIFLTKVVKVTSL